VSIAVSRDPLKLKMWFSKFFDVFDALEFVVYAGLGTVLFLGIRTE